MAARPNRGDWHRALDGSGLRSTVRFYLLALGSFMNADGSKCFPTVEQIMARMGASERTVWEAKREAVAAGWVDIRRRGRSSNLYLPAIPDPADPAGTKESLDPADPAGLKDSLDPADPAGTNVGFDPADFRGSNQGLDPADYDSSTPQILPNNQSDQGKGQPTAQLSQSPGTSQSDTDEKDAPMNAVGSDQAPARGGPPICGAAGCGAQLLAPDSAARGFCYLHRALAA